ncbi:hypothetical protein ABPG75_006514 [Micractinium tetrahymenae]
MASDSLESGELPLEDGELPPEVAQEAHKGEEPRPQHPYRDEWAGPGRDGGGGSGAGRRERPLEDRYPRGPAKRSSSRGSGDGGWGYAGPGPRRRSPSPPPGRGGHLPQRRGPRGPPPGRYPPLPPQEPPLPPVAFSRDRSHERGSSRPRSRTRSPLLRSPRSRSPPARSPSPPVVPRAASPRPAHAPSANEEAARDAREMDNLAADIKSLCRGLTLPECMKNLERVCSDLRTVVHKLSSYLQLLKKRDEAVKSADDSEALSSLAAGLVSGLKALHVFSNTGQGRRMPAAREPVRAAWRAREELLSAAQRRQFEGFVSSSRNFSGLLEDKSPSPEPVRRDYVPAPRAQPQPRERKQKRQAVEEGGSGEDGQPAALSKRQLKRLQAAQRAEAAAAEAAAAKQRQLEQAARQAAAAEARRKAAEEEAANKRYKLTIKLGTSSLPAEPAVLPPAPDQQQGQQPAPEEAALAAALDDHWRWHQQQQQQQQQQAAAAVQREVEEAPPLPPDIDDAPGGWQAVPSPLDAPLSPMSAPASPAAPAAAAAVAANGSAGAGAGLGLNPEALEHAAKPTANECCQTPARGPDMGPQAICGAAPPPMPTCLPTLNPSASRQGKLCLVLDLDHTLLNSATFSEVGPSVHASLDAQAAHEAATLPEGQRLLFRMGAIKMWTKLRPAVREFLHSASRLFQLWIHTNGNRAYADSVVRLLDPSRQLFGDRIIAQGAERVDQMVADQEKRLMQGLAECESITVIVDDSHSVWSQHRHNLVAVERYIYFPSSRASLGLKGPSLMDTGRDEDAERGMLMVALDVLGRVHDAVLRALRAPPLPLPTGELVFQNWDVRYALATERQQVLRGVRLVFTRVIPLETEPSSHPLWRLAESFGARCSTVLDGTTTHVVAGASGTEKVLQARAAGKWVVTPAWLECSCILWKRASEERFLVPP